MMGKDDFYYDTVWSNHDNTKHMPRDCKASFMPWNLSYLKILTIVGL